MSFLPATLPLSGAALPVSATTLYAGQRALRKERKSKRGRKQRRALEEERRRALLAENPESIRTLQTGIGVHQDPLVRRSVLGA
ncbi:MAG: hypothetical protein JSV86_05980 [Gemmatimonadota bacterium]|nr:MAG: hypothetical protein JSV86_05980 [Gemmatimonadota bacterium]